MRTSNLLIFDEEIPGRRLPAGLLRMFHSLLNAVVHRTQQATLVVALALALLTALGGCRLPRRDFTTISEDRSVYDTTGLQLEEPDIDSHDVDGISGTNPPTTLLSRRDPEYWNLRLEEAVQIALTNSRVLRDLGGVVLRSPTQTRTIQDPAIVETDPRFGVEAALSAFDAQFATNAFFEKNDRALNNVFFGGGSRFLQQDGHVYESQITKRGVAGTELTLSNNTDYDSNTAPGNLFRSSWSTNIEALVRQPLLQGGGVEFNRIYGPTGTPGLPNGVLIARANTDISLAEFELSVRNYVSDVENAYWDLYFAYRDLDAKVRARDAALETWRRISALHAAGRRGGDAQQEAQAREQYFRFQEDVQNALTGRLVEGTKTNNGSSGGTFRGTGGVHVAERRLRKLIGIPLSDGRLIRPAEDPEVAKVSFDWNVALAEALTRRPELRRQKWVIKRRELELIGSKNLVLPRLDAIGRYRWRGFGKELIAYSDPRDLGDFNSAWGNLLGGDFQEWQLGVEFSMPLGFRRAHTTVRNAELQLARERAILAEQEREIALDLSNAIADIERAHAVVETSFNRRIAAKQQLDAIQAIEDPSTQTLYLELDAQRRLAEAEIQYYRTLVEYALSIKNVHFEKGSLLEYDGVALSELPWPEKAYRDAYERVRLRRRLSDGTAGLVSPPETVSRGLHPQFMNPSPAPPRPQDLPGSSHATPSRPEPPMREREPATSPRRDATGFNAGRAPQLSTIEPEPDEFELSRAGFRSVPVLGGGLEFDPEETAYPAAADDDQPVRLAVPLDDDATAEPRR
jgi:outer membrane protein TolC